MPDAPIRGQGVTFDQLFYHHIFKLDYYQREYSWTRQDVSALLQDLNRHFTNQRRTHHEREHVRDYSPYFLGSIVFHKVDDATFLVDGQQRVTTLLLILVHLRRLALDLDLDDEIRQVENLIWSHRRRARFRLDVPDLNDALTAMVEDRPYEPSPESSPSVRNFVQRGADLAEDFPPDLSGDALSMFIEWLLDKVCLVEVQADGPKQAWEIFETVNDRGQRPGPVDLLKSHVLTMAEFDQDALNAEWRRAFSELSIVDAKAPSDFVKAMLVAKYAGADDDVAGMAATFHEWVRVNAARMGLRLASDYRRFVEHDLVQLGGRYRTLRLAAAGWNDAMPAVRFNEYNRVPHHLTAVLAAIRPDDSDDAFYRKAVLVSGYLDLIYVRRMVNGAVGTADLETDVLALVPELRACGELDEIRRLLSAAVALVDDDFSKMDTFGLRPDNRAAVRYVLGRITAFVDGECGRHNQMPEFLAASRPFDIEHIWANKFERFQGEVATVANFNSWRNRLGALLLLPRSDNAAFGADPYARKVEHYQRANMLAASLHPNSYDRNPRFTRFLRRQDLAGLFGRGYVDFGVEAIKGRQALYQKLCELVWNPVALGLIVPTVKPTRGPAASRTRARYRVKVRQLVEVGAITAGARLVGAQRGVEHRARVTANGMIELETGETFTDPSPAGAFVLNVKACSGWDFWSVVEGRGRRRSLKEIRNDALKKGLLERAR